MARAESFSGLPPGLVLVGYVPEESTKVTIHKDAGVHAELLVINQKLEHIMRAVSAVQQTERRGWLERFLVWIKAIH